MGNVPLSAVVEGVLSILDDVEVAMCGLDAVGIYVCVDVDEEFAGFEFIVDVIRTSFFAVATSSTTYISCVVTLEADTVRIVEQLDLFAYAAVGLCAFKAFDYVAYANARITLTCNFKNRRLIGEIIYILNVYFSSENGNGLSERLVGNSSFHT